MAKYLPTYKLTLFDSTDYGVRRYKHRNQTFNPPGRYVRQMKKTRQWNKIIEYKNDTYRYSFESRIGF